MPHLVTVLENWRERRIDRRVESYWRLIAAQRELTAYEEYQREWNFVEADYSDRPSNNGLDFANPAFAFHTKLAKYLVVKVV